MLQGEKRVKDCGISLLLRDPFTVWSIVSLKLFESSPPPLRFVINLRRSTTGQVWNQTTAYYFKFEGETTSKKDTLYQKGACQYLFIEKLRVAGDKTIELISKAAHSFRP